jgi:hypothetical protein
MEFIITKDDWDKLQNDKTRMVQLFKSKLEFRAFDYGQETINIKMEEVVKGENQDG